MTLVVDYILFVDRNKYNKQATVYDVPKGDESEVHNYVKERIVSAEKTSPKFVKIMNWIETE